MWALVVRSFDSVSCYSMQLFFSSRWENNKGAEVICKQLGYDGGHKYTAPGGTGPIQAGNRLCDGGEATVWDCELQSSELKECTHDHDQGVDCYKGKWSYKY